MFLSKSVMCCMIRCAAVFSKKGTLGSLLRPVSWLLPAPEQQGCPKVARLLVHPPTPPALCGGDFYAVWNIGTTGVRCTGGCVQHYLGCQHHVCYSFVCPHVRMRYPRGRVMFAAVGCVCLEQCHMLHDPLCGRVWQGMSPKISLTCACWCTGCYLRWSNNGMVSKGGHVTFSYGFLMDCHWHFSHPPSPPALCGGDVYAVCNIATTGVQCTGGCVQHSLGCQHHVCYPFVGPHVRMCFPRGRVMFAAVGCVCLEQCHMLHDPLCGRVWQGMSPKISLTCACWCTGCYLRWSKKGMVSKGGHVTFSYGFTMDCY